MYKDTLFGKNTACPFVLFGEKTSESKQLLHDNYIVKKFVFYFPIIFFITLVKYFTGEKELFCTVISDLACSSRYF